MNFSKSATLSVPEYVHSIVFEEKDGFPSSVTLLNFETGEFYSLDEVGLDFWRLVEEKKNLEEIVSALTPKYDINVDQLWIDIKAFVASLVEKGIITVLIPS